MQFYGDDALNDIDDQQQINPAAFFTDDVESNTQLLMLELYGKEKSYEEYRKTGVHRFQLDIPENTEELKLVAYYKVCDLNLNIYFKPYAWSSPLVTTIMVSQFTILSKTRFLFRHGKIVNFQTCLKAKSIKYTAISWKVWNSFSVKMLGEHESHPPLPFDTKSLENVQ